MSFMAILRRCRGRKLYISMRFLFALFVALTLAGLHQLIFVTPVAADEPTSFTNGFLSVYPEYDDPRLLVMMQGDVAPGTKLPLTVRFLVPAGAEMYSAGSLDAQGKYKGGPPDRKPSSVEGWDEISYNLTTNTFRVEYYVDSIKGLPDKTIAYEFRTLYPMSSLDVEVLQPAKAANFNLTPPSQSKGTAEGMTTYRYRYSNVGVEKPVSFDISYTKADSTPSVKPQQAGTTTGASNPNFVWLGGMVVAVVIAVGAVWFTTNRRRRYRPAAYGRARMAQRSPVGARPAPARTPATPAASRASRATKGARREEENPVFCRKCGTRLDPTVRFCNRCGTRAG